MDWGAILKVLHFDDRNFFYVITPSVANLMFTSWCLLRPSPWCTMVRVRARIPLGRKKIEWKVPPAPSSYAPPWPSWRLVIQLVPSVIMAATGWCGQNSDLSLEFRFHNPKLSCEHSKSAHVWVYWNALGRPPNQMDVSSQTKIVLRVSGGANRIEKFYYTKYVTSWFFIFYFYFPDQHKIWSLIFTYRPPGGRILL